MGTGGGSGLGAFGSLLSLGGVIYNLFFAPQPPPPTPQKIQINNFVRLAPVPIVYGTDLLAGTVIFIGKIGYEFIDISAKGMITTLLSMIMSGAIQEEMVYTAEFCVCMGEGPLNAITSIYINDEPISAQNTVGPDTQGLFNLSSRIYLGTGNQIIDPGVSRFLTKGIHPKDIHCNVDDSLASTYNLFPYHSTSNLIYADFSSVPLGYWNQSYGTITHGGNIYVFEIENQESYYILLGANLTFTPTSGDVLHIVLNPNTSWDVSGKAIPWRNTGYIYLNGMIGTNTIPTITAEVAGLFATDSSSLGLNWATIGTFTLESGTWSNYVIYPTNPDYNDLILLTAPEIADLPDSISYFLYNKQFNYIAWYEVNTTKAVLSWKKDTPQYQQIYDEFVFFMEGVPGSLIYAIYWSGTTCIDWIDSSGGIITHKDIGNTYSLIIQPNGISGYYPYSAGFFSGYIYVVMAGAFFGEEEYNGHYTFWKYDTALSGGGLSLVPLENNLVSTINYGLPTMVGDKLGSRFRQYGIWIIPSSDGKHLCITNETSINDMCLIPTGINVIDILYVPLENTFYILCSQGYNLYLYSYGTPWNLLATMDIGQLGYGTIRYDGGDTIWIIINYEPTWQLQQRIITYSINTKSWQIVTPPYQAEAQSTITIWKNNIYESWGDSYGVVGFQYIRNYNGSASDANPIACCYDFMTNSRYGMGMSPSLFDGSPTTTGSWATEYNYCFELVTTPALDVSSISNFESPIEILEPRFLYSNTIKTPTKGYEIINSILSTCRGFLYSNNGLIGVHIEKPNETPVLYFGLDSKTYTVTG